MSRLGITVLGATVLLVVMSGCCGTNYRCGTCGGYMRACHARSVKYAAPAQQVMMPLGCPRMARGDMTCPCAACGMMREQAKSCPCPMCEMMRDRIRSQREGMRMREGRIGEGPEMKPLDQPLGEPRDYIVPAPGVVPDEAPTPTTLPRTY